MRRPLAEQLVTGTARAIVRAVNVELDARYLGYERPVLVVALLSQPVLRRERVHTVGGTGGGSAGQPSRCWPRTLLGH